MYSLFPFLLLLLLLLLLYVRLFPSLQLYIKVSGGTSSQQATATSDDTDGQSGAMELLDPHLPQLSLYWLAALMDHAHISLPPQFSSQLPPSGGMFYSPNVADAVKPYFKQSWPPLLHATAVWLQVTGLSEDETASAPPLPTPPMATLHPLMPKPLLASFATSYPPASSLSPLPSLLGDVKRDRLYLVLGLAVQTLCNPASLDHPSLLLHCLKSIQALLLAPYVQAEVCRDSKLAIELLNLLHRLLLTCQSQDIHVLVMHIAQCVGQALHGTKIKEEVATTNEEEELESGKSRVFALMEVTACCLLRLVPDLKPKELESSTVTSSLPTPSHQELDVLSQAIGLLISATSLCSPVAAEKVLPAALHLLLHTTKYAASLQSSSPALLSSCLRSLQQLCLELPLSNSTHGPYLSHTMRAALTSLLEPRGGSGKENTLCQVDREVKILLVAIFLRVPSSPSICPAATALFDLCVQLFRECLSAPSTKVSTAIYCTGALLVAILFMVFAVNILVTFVKLGICG